MKHTNLYTKDKLKFKLKCRYTEAARILTLDDLNTLTEEHLLTGNHVNDEGCSVNRFHRIYAITPHNTEPLITITHPPGWRLKLEDRSVVQSWLVYTYNLIRMRGGGFDWYKYIIFQHEPDIFGYVLCKNSFMTCGGTGGLKYLEKLY